MHANQLNVPIRDSVAEISAPSAGGECVQAQTTRSPANRTISPPLARTVSAMTGNTAEMRSARQSLLAKDNLDKVIGT